MASFAEAIRAIGVEHCILSTDLGQPNNPLPPDGFGGFLVALRQQGFTHAADRPDGQGEPGTPARPDPIRVCLNWLRRKS